MTCHVQKSVSSPFMSPWAIADALSWRRYSYDFPCQFVNDFSSVNRRLAAFKHTVTSVGSYELSGRTELALYTRYVPQNAEFSSWIASVTTARWLSPQGVHFNLLGDFLTLRFFRFVIISELDHDAFSFSNLEECFPSDDKGTTDG